MIKGIRVNPSVHWLKKTRVAAYGYSTGFTYELELGVILEFYIFFQRLSVGLLELGVFLELYFISFIFLVKVKVKVM